MSFIEEIQHVADGEPVDASTTARATQQLEQNTRNLRDLVELSLLGQVIIVREQSIDPTLMPSQAVYWNSDNARFEAALASVALDADLGVLLGTPQSECLGVVYQKTGTTTADILLMGWIKLDITNALDGQPLAAGRYYLSGSTPGMLVQSRGSLSVPVLYATGDGYVQVIPQWRQWAEDHQHYRVPLHCVPAGDYVAPGMGERAEITNPDSSMPGWLPANHAIFDGKAPANAAFGYNISQHAQLRRLFPPLPPEASVLIWDKGVDTTGGTEVPMGREGLAVIDKNGIWWLSNCPDDVPWPADFDFIDGSTADSVSQTITDIECPRATNMLLTLYFNRTLYEAALTLVTSLRADPDSIIRVYGCDGQPAATGDLIVSADLALVIDETDQAGHLVLKTIVDNKFKQGPVLEGIINATPSGLDISSTHSQVIDGETVHQGIATIGLSPDPVDRELPPIVTYLHDTKERYESGVLYIGFPPNFQSSIVRVYQVPPDGIASGTKIEVRLTVLGTTNGTLPNMTVGYRRLPRGTSTPQAIPTTDTALTLASLGSLVAGNKYVEAKTNQFNVVAGDTVQIVITRNTSDGYSGELGIIRTAAVLISPAD